MSKLQELLALPDVSEITGEVLINEQLGKFTVRPVTEKQLQGYRVRSRMGKKKDDDIDASKLNCLIIENHLIDPNLNNAEFLAQAKCATASEFINKKFTAGIVTKIVKGIFEVSDMGDIEEDIEEAKN